jgi:hypothetical protein
MFGKTKADIKKCDKLKGKRSPRHFLATHNTLYPNSELPRGPYHTVSYFIMMYRSVSYRKRTGTFPYHILLYYDQYDVPVPDRRVPYHRAIPCLTVPCKRTHMALTLGRKRGRQARTLVFAEKKNKMHRKFLYLNHEAKEYRRQSDRTSCYWIPVPHRTVM